MNRHELHLLAELSDPDEGVVGAMAALEGDLLLLGAGGKMGYGIALMALRAFKEAGKSNRVIAASRFSDRELREQIELEGITTLACDLLDAEAVRGLPDAPNVMSLVGQKFGTSQSPGLTWVTNTVIPAMICQRFCDSQIVAFSSGNVYPLTPVDSRGASEQTPLAPVGEYGQTVLGRERVYDYYSRTQGTPATIVRLNYANEPRYGVLVDIAMKVRRGEAIDVTMGCVNVLWATDANRVGLKCFELTSSPPTTINLAGPRVVSVREVAAMFGAAFGVDPVITGTEASTALLSDATKCWTRFGGPEAEVDYMVRRIADWIMQGYPVWAKPTHFEVRGGTF
jgi:nucleoside-diphosphate-sugar epimerase